MLIDLLYKKLIVLQQLLMDHLSSAIYLRLLLLVILLLKSGSVSHLKMLLLPVYSCLYRTTSASVYLRVLEDT